MSVALVGLARLTKKVSSSSSSVSPRTSTVIVRDTWPGLKVRVPLTALSSTPARGRAVGEQVRDGDGPAAGGREAHGEGGGDRARVPFGVTVASRSRRWASRSLSRIVPRPGPRPMVAAFVLLLVKLTKKVSSSSSSVSPLIATVKVRLVTPGRKVRKELAVVKSAPAVAVPLAVAGGADSRRVGADKVTVKVMLTVPESLAVTLASLIEAVVSSSSQIVPRPLESPNSRSRVAQVDEEGSSSSSSVSPRRFTVIVFDVSPGANVGVPLVAL